MDLCKILSQLTDLLAPGADLAVAMAKFADLLEQYPQIITSSTAIPPNDPNYQQFADLARSLAGQFFDKGIVVGAGELWYLTKCQFFHGHFDVAGSFQGKTLQKPVAWFYFIQSAVGMIFLDANPEGQEIYGALN